MLISDDKLAAILEKVWKKVEERYAEGNRFRWERDLRDFMFDRLVAVLDERIVQKEVPMKEKKADLVLRVGQVGGVIAELKCAVYDTGPIHEKDALADIDKLVWYLSSEGFSYAYFCMLAEFEKRDKLERIKKQIRLTQSQEPRLRSMILEPCSKKNFALGFSKQDTICKSCKFIKPCEKVAPKV